MALNTIDKVWLENLNNDIWANRIDKNYAMAINYYKSRKEMFIRYWTSLMKTQYANNWLQFLENGRHQTSQLIQYIISKYWQIYNQLDPTKWTTQMNGESDKQYKARLSELRKDNAVSLLRFDLAKNYGTILPANFFSAGSQFWQNIGKIFEEQMGPSITKQLQNALKTGVGQCIAEFTGGINALNAIKGGTWGESTGRKPVQMTSDIVFRNSATDSIASNGDMTHNGHVVTGELQTQISLSNYNDISDAIAKNPEIAVWLDQNYVGGLGGINVKSFSWATGKNATNYNGKKFGSSAEMQSHLNHLLNSMGKTNGFYTGDWVQLFVIFELSNYLLNIISPNAVIFATKDRFQWFDEMLKEAYFYMRVTSFGNAHLVAEDGGEITKLDPSTIRERHGEYSRFAVTSANILLLSRIKRTMALRAMAEADAKLLSYGEPEITVTTKEVLKSGITRGLDLLSLK